MLRQNVVVHRSLVVDRLQNVLVPSGFVHDHSGPHVENQNGSGFLIRSTSSGRRRGVRFRQQPLRTVPHASDGLLLEPKKCDRSHRLIRDGSATGLLQRWFISVLFLIRTVHVCVTALIASNGNNRQTLYGITKRARTRRRRVVLPGRIPAESSLRTVRILPVNERLQTTLKNALNGISLK